jgi:hypothetical protein
MGTEDVVKKLIFELLPKVIDALKWFSKKARRADILVAII